MHSTDFVALYRGPTVGEARLVAVTAEPEVVWQVVRALAGDGTEPGRKGDVRVPLRRPRFHDEAG